MKLHKFSLSLASKKEADGTVWNEVAYEGQWSGHPSGDFQFTRQIFDEIVSNSKRRSDAMPVRFGHPDREDPIAMQMAEYLGQAGWIQELKVEKNTRGIPALFGRMKWTERTASKITADEIRYCSVVVTFGGINEVTGENVGAELIELGVVGAAFLDGMTPLAASRAGRNQTRALAQKKDSKMDELAITKKIMKELGENFTVAKLAELVENEMRRQEIIDGKGADAPTEDPAEDVAASATPAETAKVVEAADVPAEPGVEPDEAAAAADAQFVDFGHALATEMNLDLPALLASFEENRDGIMAALRATPEEGTPADGDMAEMSASHQGAVVALSKAEAKTVELSKRVADLEHKNELAAFEVELSRHCVETKILDQTRIELMKTATDPDYGNKALTVARKLLAAALDKGTGVPTELAYKPKSAKETKSTVEGGRSRAAILVECRKQALVDDPSLAKKKRSVQHNAALKLAKSLPEFNEAE